MKPSELLPEVNIGLVGHVDHGKTTLTQALTGKWTDTHSEEIKRGITIRLGYADATFYRCQKCTGHRAWSTNPKCPNCGSPTQAVRTVSFVDAPGHETLMTTVLSGAALMNGALLVISAAEPCPQPQTREHLTALDIVGIRNVVVVQNKIDLVDEQQAMKSYEQIKVFLKGSVAENAPIIPVSAQHRLGIGALIEAIQATIPTPNYDLTKPPKALIARSFDINKPGTEIQKLRGGVLGGALLQGQLKVGDEIEIRPGIKLKETWHPLLTKIVGLQKAMHDISVATPGGLLGIATSLDPALTKADSLAGQVAGLTGKLPPVLSEIKFTINLLERVVGTREELKVSPIKIGDVLMLTVGIARTVGTVSKIGKAIEVKLKIPICAEAGERIAISRQVAGRWRLIGCGQLL